MILLAKTKEENKKVENEKEIVKDDFDINELYNQISPYLVPGLKRYIFDNNIQITNEKEFKKVYEHYGGF